MPAYQKTTGVSGNLNSVGSDTMNNLMTLWGEAFAKMYPNVKIQVEGKGSSTAPPALIAGTAQFGPMSRADARDRDRPVREEVRLQADPAPHLVRRPRRLRQQGQPAREADAGPGRRASSPRRRKRGGKNAATWGDLGLTGDWASRPHQPLRPQLGQRHLRLLQGARARQRRLQGHGEGAAGLGVRRAGRDRGPLRHRLQRHRLQDLRREGRAARRKDGGAYSDGSYEDVVERQVPAGALPLRLHQQGARASRSTRWCRSS